MKKKNESAAESSAAANSKQSQTPAAKLAWRFNPKFNPESLDLVFLDNIAGAGSGDCESLWELCNHWALQLTGERESQSAAGFDILVAPLLGELTARDRARLAAVYERWAALLEDEQQRRAAAEAAARAAQEQQDQEEQPQSDENQNRPVSVSFPASVVPLIDQAAKQAGLGTPAWICEAVQEKIDRVASTAARAAQEESQIATEPSNPPLAPLPMAIPSREMSLQEMQQIGHRHLNMPIEPPLYLWAARELSDPECLCFVCVAISRNEELLHRLALRDDSRQKWAGEHLIVISIAKGIAERPSKFLEKDIIRFENLPGLLGKNGITVREALEHTALLLYRERTELAKTTIPQMKDRGAALELAETLVIAEKACTRAGYDTDEAKPGCQHWTPVVLLVHQLLKEVLMSH